MNNENKSGSFLSQKLCKIVSALGIGFGVADYFVDEMRSLPMKPFKILDAPDMEDDYYKQIFHWSPINNKIAVGLNNAVFIWDANKQRASQLCEFLEYEELCSLRWNPDGSQLAFGMDTGEIKIWDINRNKSISNLFTHNNKVSCLDWKTNLISGSKDKSILISDPRNNSILKSFKSHTKQVLNVSEANNNQPYILSGGNDSRAFVFDKRKENEYLMKVVHQAPVRAIGWDGQRNGVFGTGGGSADQMLKVWDVYERVMVDEVCTNGQICDLVFSGREVITALGGDFNCVNFYSGNGLKNVGSLNGHRRRVLNVQMSPNNSQLVSISPDETMRFWAINNAFNQNNKTKKIYA